MTENEAKFAFSLLAGGFCIGIMCTVFLIDRKETVCPESKTIVEQVKVPVGQDELFDDLNNCRKQMLELNEACNGDINCRDKDCK